VRVLTVNAGSSSLKLRLVGPGDVVYAARDLELPDGVIDPDAAGAALAQLGDAEAVAHRIVHGGRAVRPERIDAAARERISGLAHLAPLHQERALAAIDVATAARPELPAVACFDTAFHARMPAAAATYALPEAWRERHGLHRFGFHGLSHAWVARRARTGERLVSCHLGAGASVAAIRDGRSLDTTMGFTPLEGVVMATRSGSVDPGMLVWLLREGGLSPAALEHGLQHESGLLGLAGSGDMRELLDRRDPAAKLALDVYVHRLRAAIAAMAAALGGLDVLAFTGGIGEHADAIRGRVAEGLAFLGVELDTRGNQAAQADADIGAADAGVRTLVVTAREDAEMARQTRAALRGSVTGGS